MEHILEIKVVEGRCFVILNQERYTLGRSKSNSIVIKDPQVSRYHATVIGKRNEYIDDYEYTIIDGDLEKKKSRNGLIINQKKIQIRLLENKDVIQLGKNVILKYYRASQATLNLLKSAYKNNLSVSSVTGAGIEMIPSWLKKNEEERKMDIALSLKKTITGLNKFNYDEELKILAQRYK
ncbi:MAG: FHA domain-containing protein [Prochloraceae cyanobacterium]